MGRLIARRTASERARLAHCIWTHAAACQWCHFSAALQLDRTWNTSTPRICTLRTPARAPPAASVLDDRAGSMTLRPSDWALSASDPGLMHSTRAKTRSNCRIAAISTKSVNCTTVTVLLTIGVAKKRNHEGHSLTLEYSHSRRFTTWAFWVVSCGNFCFSEQVTTYRTLSWYQLEYFRTIISANGVPIYRKWSGIFETVHSSGPQVSLTAHCEILWT